MFHYDYLGKRFAMEVHVRQDYRDLHYRVLDNWGLKKRFVIRDEFCTMGPLTEEMRPPCISDELEFVQFSVAGGGPERLELESWHLKSSDSYVRDTVSVPGCYPFGYRRTFNGTYRPWVPDYVVHMGTFNRLEEGIRDQDVFEIPEQCKIVAQVDMPLEVKMIESLFLKE